MQRYTFYATALDAMQNSVPQNQGTNRTIFDLGFFATMSQTASSTLRSSAKEADFYIRRYGEMKTASGSLAIAPGILGVLGLVLSPFGGVALTSAA